MPSNAIGHFSGDPIRRGLGNVGVRGGVRGLRQDARSTLRHRFTIQPHARRPIENYDRTVGVSSAYVQASMDLVMGDLLNSLRSSQKFSVFGLPDPRIEQSEDEEYRVELLGFDVFDSVAMDSAHRKGKDVLGLVPRYRLQRALLPRLSDFLSTNLGVGRAQALASDRVRRQPVGASFGHGQCAVPPRRTRSNRGEGRRRSGQRADRRQAPLGRTKVHSGDATAKGFAAYRP